MTTEPTGTQAAEVSHADWRACILYEMTDPEGSNEGIADWLADHLVAAEARALAAEQERDELQQQVGYTDCPWPEHGGKCWRATKDLRASTHMAGSPLELAEQQNVALREALDESGDWIIASVTPVYRRIDRDNLLGKIDAALAATPAQQPSSEAGP